MLYDGVEYINCGGSQQIGRGWMMRMNPVDPKLGCIAGEY